VVAAGATGAAEADITGATETGAIEDFDSSLTAAGAVGLLETEAADGAAVGAAAGAVPFLFGLVGFDVEDGPPMTGAGGGAIEEDMVTDTGSAVDSDVTDGCEVLGEF
jgi:hypothetical protein